MWVFLQLVVIYLLFNLQLHNNLLSSILKQESFIILTWYIAIMLCRHLDTFVQPKNAHLPVHFWPIVRCTILYTLAISF